MGKKIIATSSAITFIVVIVMLSFSLILVSGEPTNVTFTVNLTLTGNSAPTITWVESGISASPLESNERTVYFTFNVTDNNGFADVDYSTAEIVLIVDEQHRSSGSCVAFNNDSLVMQLNCSVNMQYYDLSGSWTINASIQDLATSYDEDTATTFTYGTLFALRGNLDGVAFGNVNLGQTVNASNDPLILNNTGNQNFTTLNMTAYNLVGQGAQPDQYIDSTNLYVNSSDNFGFQMVNKTAVTLTGTTLSRDIGGSDSNVNLYFWATIPAAGLSNQDYASSSPWVLEVFPNS